MKQKLKQKLEAACRISRGTILLITDSTCHSFKPKDVALFISDNIGGEEDTYDHQIIIPKVLFLDALDVLLDSQETK